MELCNPKKARYDHLSSVNVKFSWGETTDEEHPLCGKDDIRWLAESPFAALIHWLQTFEKILRIHAPAIGYARMRDDFQWNLKNHRHDHFYDFQETCDIHYFVFYWVFLLRLETLKRQLMTNNLSQRKSKESNFVSRNLLQLNKMM